MGSAPLPPHVARDDDSSLQGAETGAINQRVAITMVGMLIGGVLMFANEILAARFLGLELYGCYALAIVVSRIGEVISMMGVGIGVLHFIPIYRNRDDKPRLLGAILLALCLPICIGSLLATGVWFAAPWIATEWIRDPQSLPYFRWFAISIPLLGLSEICGRITRSFGHAIYHALIRDIVPRCVGLLLLLWLFLQDGDRLWIAGTFFAGYVLASIVGVITVCIVSGRELWHVKPQVPIREMSRYSFPSFVTILLSLVMGAIEYLMIGVLRTTAEAGLFRGALQFASLLQIITNAFAASTVHLYPVLVDTGRRAELRKVYGVATRSVNALASSLFVIIALNRLNLLQLLGPEFSAAASCLFLLLISNMIRGCTGISPFVLLVTRRQKSEMLNSTMGIALSIVFHLWLIPLYGIEGAALATCITSLALAIIRTWQMRQHYGLVTWDLSRIRPIVVSLVTGLAVWIVAEIVGFPDGSGVASLIFRATLGGCLLFGSLWLTREQTEN